MATNDPRVENDCFDCPRLKETAHITIQYTDVYANRPGGPIGTEIGKCNCDGKDRCGIAFQLPSGAVAWHWDLCEHSTLRSNGTR